MRFQITEVTLLRHIHKCYGYLQSFLRHTCLRSVLLKYRYREAKESLTCEHNVFVSWKQAKGHKSEISKAQRCHLNWFKCTGTGKRWGRVHCSSLASRLALSFFVSSCTVSSQSRGYTARVAWEQQMAPKAICLRWCLADYTAWYRFIMQVGTTTSDHICSKYHPQLL